MRVVAAETRLLRHEVADLADAIRLSVALDGPGGTLVQINQQLTALRTLFEARYGASLVVSPGGEICYELDESHGELDARNRNVEQPQRRLNRDYGNERRDVAEWSGSWLELEKLARTTRVNKETARKARLEEEEKGKGKGKATKKDMEKWDGELAEKMQEDEYEKSADEEMPDAES
jgi:hypothetical protein